MKHCIIQDSSFIVAIISENDAFHKDAVFASSQILKYKNKIKIIIPPLGLFEIITTLARKGIEYNTIEQKILELLHMDEIIATSVSEVAALKYCKSVLNCNSQKDALRTVDFLIVSLAMDYNAQILTFDKKMWQKTKQVYKDIFYCSSLGNTKDETAEFLKSLSNL